MSFCGVSNLKHYLSVKSQKKIKFKMHTSDDDKIETSEKSLAYRQANLGSPVILQGPKIYVSEKICRVLGARSLCLQTDLL